MPKTSDLDWQSLEQVNPHQLLSSKRSLKDLDSQRVGWEPDWKLRVVMLKEARDEHNSEIARLRARDPDYQRAASEGLKSAWARGAFAERKQGYAKRTDALVNSAKRMRADGCTYQRIGDALNVTAYTAAKWLGWERKPEPTNRVPIVVNGVTYPSLRAAERETGIPRHRLDKCRPTRHIPP